MFQAQEKVITLAYGSGEGGWRIFPTSGSEDNLIVLLRIEPVLELVSARAPII